MVVKMILIGLLYTLVGFSLGGSPCPPRENIYPCSCLTIPLTKKNEFATSVSCHRLPSTDALDRIFPTLKTMTIDYFHLYDSFWEASNLQSPNEDKQVLPEDWLSLLKIKEIEIVDTTLSKCFPCNSKMTCRNDVTTRFTAINSSSHDEICTLCKNKSGKQFSWIYCLNRLRQFQFRNARLTVVRADMFPLKMRQLTEVDLSHNSISKIDTNAFQFLVKLKVLKLSHNVLESTATLTLKKLEELEELDLSWNQINALSKDFMSAFPKLKTLLINNNYLVSLIEDNWKNFPQKTLRLIDLTDNPIECNCNIRWLNGTFPTYTVIKGSCADPEEYEGMAIRTASRNLVERCDEDGKIGTRQRTTKAPVTKAMYVP